MAEQGSFHLKVKMYSLDFGGLNDCSSPKLLVAWGEAGSFPGFKTLERLSNGILPSSSEMTQKAEKSNIGETSHSHASRNDQCNVVGQTPQPSYQS